MPGLRVESSIPSKMAGFKGLYEERYRYVFTISHVIQGISTLPQSVANELIKLSFTFTCIVPNNLHVAQLSVVT